jgi:hypothetical protein
MKKAIVIAAVTGMVFGGFYAELFTFDLINKEGASWDNVSSGIYTQVGSGLTLKASMFAYLNGSNSAGSLLNSTASEFGINAVGSGDATSLFDTNNGQEALWVSFDRAVTIKSITVSSFTAGNVETGAYQVANGSLVTFTAGGTYTIDTAMDQGAFFKIIALDEGGGNGWSLNSFSVEAIPEPATVILLGIGGLAACIFRRILRR